MTMTVGVPSAEYDRMNTTASCTEAARTALAKFMETEPFEHILLFGPGQTGQSVQPLLGDRFAGFVETSSLAGMKGDEGDCVLITTSPVHVKEIGLLLAESSLADLPVIRLFEDSPLALRLILETQPRCGTDYTIHNLQRAFGMGYASAFHIEGGETTPDGLVMYHSEECDGYVAKAHFTKTLHYPQYRYIPTVFVVGYFPDTYYRWARMVAGVPKAERNGYFLRADSPEWKLVRAYIPRHLDWLQYIVKRDYFRYEDYFTGFEGVMDIFTRLLGKYPSLWETPKKIGSRIYWTDNLSACMDEEVQQTLAGAFKSHLRFFYPEKS